MFSSELSPKISLLQVGSRRQDRKWEELTLLGDSRQLHTLPPEALKKVAFPVHPRAETAGRQPVPCKCQWL